MNNNTYSHNDVTLTTTGQSSTFIHHENAFPSFTSSAEEQISYFHELYSTPEHGVKVWLHLHYLAYVITNSQGIVIGKKLQSYNEAVKKADEVDRDYARWLVEHTFKGLPKSKFIKDVKEGKLQSKRVFCARDKGAVDTEFHSLWKRKGFGSIDIYQPGKGYCALFYINDMTAERIVYTGDELFIFNSGFRLLNEEEKLVLAEWESMRDLEAERIDALSDGSCEYWRKKCFFEEKGMGHLMVIYDRGLVRDDNLRGELNLKYEIKRK